MARKIEKKICTCCGKELQLKEFYKSASTMYDGKLPICKNCLADRYNTLLTTYEGSSIDAFKHLMMNLDEYKGIIPEPYYSKLREAMYNYEVEIDD